MKKKLVLKKSQYDSISCGIDLLSCGIGLLKHHTGERQSQLMNDPFNNNLRKLIHHLMTELDKSL